MRIGFIDWIEEKLSLYVFERKAGQYILVDTISATPEGELNQSLLKSIVKSNIEHVYLSVPANLLSLRELGFPFSDKTKIKDTISYELEGSLLDETINYSIDYLITESSESGSRVLAACMEKIKLKEIIDLFSSVGLEPVVITSLDLRLSGRNIETLLEGPTSGEEVRTEAAREELLSPSINMRQNELAYRGDVERIKKSLRLTGVLVLLLLFILGSGTTIKLLFLKKENTLLTKELHSIYHDAFPEDVKIVDVMRQFKGNLNSLREKKVLVGGIPVLEILLKISHVEKESITLNEFNVDGENILIKGSALSFENVDSFKNMLSSSFSEVKVIDSMSSPDKKISFSIIMREKMS